MNQEKEIIENELKLGSAVKSVSLPQHCLCGSNRVHQDCKVHQLVDPVGYALLLSLE